MIEGITLPERYTAEVAPGEEQSQRTTPTGRDPVRVAVLLIAIVVVVAAVTYLGPILKPFLVGVFLYFSTKAAAGFLIRLRFPAFLAYLALFAVGSAAVAALVLLAYGEAMSFRAAWPHYQQRILDVIGRGPEDTSRPLAEMFKLSSREVFKHIFERGIGVVELLTMTFFYLLFIILGAGRLPQRVQKAFPGGQGEYILSVASQIGTGMERFMQVKTLVSAGMGASAALLMYLFGLHGWLLWGILFFAFNYITYIGSFVACVPPVALAFLDLDSPIAATVLAALVVLNRFLWIDYIEIRMSGKHLNIDSILLFLWLAYWGWMWGVIGLILAFPMVTSLKIILEHLESTRGWAVLMSEE
jgi:predicted PurR-regulated permease PerM